MKKIYRSVRHTSSKKSIIVCLVIILAGLLVGLYFVFKNNEQVVQPNLVIEASKGSNSATEEAALDSQPDQTPEEANRSDSTPPTAVESPQWPVALTQPEASSLTVVVNKKHKLPSDYTPVLIGVAGGQLRPEAAEGIAQLLAAAVSADVPMTILSSYRSYTTQIATYNKWVNQSGQAAADTFSARPGHSEHQLGLAVDLGNGICNLETCFGTTAAGTWLANNAYNYGFIIRYPSGKDSITGYQYEPWHLRYVGTVAAKAITSSGLTMDEYYDVSAGDYQ